MNWKTVLLKEAILYLLLPFSSFSCSGQKTFGTEYLQLVKTIEMPGVKGRIDHLAVNVKENIIYLAASGNNSIEVVDIKKGLVLHSIEGLSEPQGVAYIPETNELIVANGGDGKCIFYNASDYAVITTLHLAGDADNIRYDSTSGKIYIGYGRGGIAVIDAANHKQAGNIELPAHPESFQLDEKNHLLLVNLPEANSVAVISLNKLNVLNTWKTKNLNANFPMALDTANNHVIIGFRHPAVLVTYDVKTGGEINRTNLVSDVDDVFYYAAGHQVLASGGGGSINIFTKYTDNTFKKFANIPTRSGTRTSLLIPALQAYVVAEPANGSMRAALVAYKINIKN